MHHVHISWLMNGVVFILSFLVSIGTLNMWARQSQSPLAKGYKLLASPVG